MYHKDFRKCSLILQESELYEYSSILDINKFKRKLNIAYDNVDDYLERQFYILREDCFFNLRHSINRIRKENIRNLKFLSKDSGVWRYDEVKFGDLSINTYNLEYDIVFKTVGNVDWADSKQLRYGSMLCLSHDNFQTYTLATVSDSNNTDLIQGRVKIHLMELPLINDRNRKKRFQMLEMEAYYESYVHVLRRLQSFDEDSFPFKNYFTEGSTKQTPVSYLCNRVPNTSTQHPMDSSQQEAFHTALTNSLSIIQGPPGTGKTTVGFRIVEKILNRYRVSYNLRTPILVVCYTNHALDQFLEKIKEICNHGDLIRIGSKSESEKLKIVNITEFVNDWKTKKLFPKYLSFRRTKLRESLNLLKECLLKEGRNYLEILADAEKYEKLLEEYKECGMEEHLMVMQTAKVIGMTTTACARYAKVMSQLACQVVIIEEAAEILEAHVICSLNSCCEQLIMIGDHQQLQPSASIENFHEVFDLNVSLFERLVLNKYRHVTLTTQRRMKPEISRCISPIYPDLKDHPMVMSYPEVQGMRTSMYFFRHSYPEEVALETSYRNMFEALFVKGICHYLIGRGVIGERITVITTYRGQKFAIKKELRGEMFKDVGVFVVDAYQGEENDVIILSLVRSNSDGLVGFLKKANRICVALSRARYGFYVVGNMDCLRARSVLWSQVDDLIGKDQGTDLPISCVRNVNHRPHIRSVNGFYDANVCDCVCLADFSCGLHSCKRKCHPGDHNHCMTLVAKTCSRGIHTSQTACSKPLDCVVPITSTLDCGHDLDHLCGDSVLRCSEMVEITLLCFHKQKVLCGSQASEVSCDRRYEQKLQCGHVYVDCYLYMADCDRDVWYSRACMHIKMIKCFQRPLEDLLTCQEEIEKTLSCSHKQLVPCSQDVSEVVCSRRSARTLSCGHGYVDCKKYEGLCHRDRNLERPCGHNKTVQCHEWAEEIGRGCQMEVRVQLACGHEETAVCGTSASKIKCKLQYRQVLGCGHPVEDCRPHVGDCLASVTVRLPCGHMKVVRCFETDFNQFCPSDCSRMLACGHICRSACDHCLGGRLHLGCQVTCQKSLFCKHPCRDRCHPGDCGGCTRGCWMTSFKNMFLSKVSGKTEARNWIHLSKTSNGSAIDVVFEEIIGFLTKESLTRSQLHNVQEAYACYKRVIEVANEVLSIGFDVDLGEHIDYVVAVLSRIFKWLNPLHRTIDPQCKEDLGWELSRLKDIFQVCVLIQTGRSTDKLRVVLGQLKAATYNGQVSLQMREMIAASHG